MARLRGPPCSSRAGAPPPAAFIERLEKELGWEFIQIYGLTETAPILTVSGPDHQNPEGEDYQRRSRAGDLGVWDEFGNVNIVDRKKDVIISGGENISSPEVEAALYKHPAVLECAVIGVPSEKWGETPKALVVLRDGMTATEEEVIAFSREHLAHFRCPTSVDFVESLPRTVTGKLQKFIIREQYWKGVERRVN